MTTFNMNDEYGSVILLDEYNGSWSLVSGNKKNDKVFKQWVYPQRREDGKNVPHSKTIPLKIELGDAKKAIEILSFFLDELYSETGTPPPSNIEDESIPF